MSQFIKFYFTSFMLNMFRTLIHPSSGSCDFSIVSTTLVVCSCFGVCWSFDVAGWGGIRVAGFSLLHRYHPNPATPKLQHTPKQEQTTNVVVQEKSRKILTMDVLMSETC